MGALNTVISFNEEAGCFSFFDADFDSVTVELDADTDYIDITPDYGGMRFTREQAKAFAAKLIELADQ